MKKIIAMTLLSLGTALPTLAQKTPVSLFNGTNLDGWVRHGEEKWYVENGELVCESGPKAEYGYLSTEKDYRNFELSLEFFQQADGNSGVFVRSTFEGTKVNGWQVEVAPKGLHTGGVYESYGRGWLVKPDPAKEEVLKEGEWNTLRIRVVDGAITSWLNGTQMIHLEDATFAKGIGAIALQIHDGGGIKVRWRNIRLLSLDPQ